jgi:hypothetical protein
MTLEEKKAVLEAKGYEFIYVPSFRASAYRVIHLGALVHFASTLGSVVESVWEEENQQ